MADKPMQLIRLARKFPDKLVSQIKKGTHTEDYVNHSVVAQRILQICGPFDWDTDVIYSENKPCAVKGILKVTIDGKLVTVTGVGTDQNNNKDIGDQIKEMESDALKRAASRIGVGLHLWAQAQYFLFPQLLQDHEVATDDVK